MDEQTIAIVWSNGEDHTVVSNVCGNCGYVFNTHDYVPSDDSICITAYKKCPECGAEFEKHMIIE